jgi:hypothetical protein
MHNVLNGSTAAMSGIVVLRICSVIVTDSLYSVCAYLDKPIDVFQIQVNRNEFTLLTPSIDQPCLLKYLLELLGHLILESGLQFE